MQSKRKCRHPLDQRVNLALGPTSNIQMFYIGYVLLLAATLVISGCNLFLVGLTGMPGWGCLRAQEPIALFVKLDVSGEQAKLAEPSGSINAGVGARIIDRHKEPSGRTTHFRVRTQDGNTGWFPWAGNQITGWHGTKCW